MKFLIDADVPRRVFYALKKLGHDVVDIRERKPTGISDDEIYSFAQQEQRIIITRDLGFSNIIIYPLGEHCGIIVLRVHMLFTEQMTWLIENFLSYVSEKELKGSLAIIQENRYRIKR
ncbi:hypothetical protein AUJ66_04400 [Candidatus Desantisbacteria bacterium CG1_02_38_46]|uniref:DUF5615 domain-containing protein n=1 Tax=Candidatus Desantisbacteria bacterium CG1_02_38_46 TaxID=1817893 RepID=A0A1J4SCH6_9BACT|nr:MAG: hypothetical protein AUJ66_04400 [Candidatus Desantisbacteria bacterium CG1_02_38_46]